MSESEGKGIVIDPSEQVILDAIKLVQPEYSPGEALMIFQKDRSSNSPRRTAELSLAEMEQRRQEDPIFALVPPELATSTTTKFCNTLRRGDLKDTQEVKRPITDLWTLATTDRATLNRYRGLGAGGMEYVLAMQSLAHLKFKEELLKRIKR